MKKKTIYRYIRVLLFFLLFSTITSATYSKNKCESQITKASRINPTTVDLIFSDKSRLTIDFYNDHIFRLFKDDSNNIIRDPEATPPAKILVNTPRKVVGELKLINELDHITIESDEIIINFDKNTTLFKIYNKENNRLILESNTPILLADKKVKLTLVEHENEYYYGGGVQNGRFSHKGKKIAIENQNSWTDGGVASPTPFFWSTKGYGILWHTFKKGFYDFGAGTPGSVELEHNTNYLDLFIMVNDGVSSLLKDLYQLTGNPILIPKFGLYEGHLNAYNRDYWEESKKGVLFEDGKYYRENQKDNGGIKESLNGEKNNYQFSARAVIDRYKNYDMPLGWLLPNDGYGAGYGQENSLDGNIDNLKSLTDYAHQNGVEIGLWTQSDLHPKEGISPLLQRDLIKEVRDAGVRVLKTDVAWVGAGYSFGLNGVTDAAQIMNYYGDNSRPFIISLDGWAGTQRYATIWSGDQTGGNWEYIRFHIPTYIGSGLSGQPNITSDMDGIFGGKKPVINIRDFQWKTFTPMQLNMDGWGSNPKYPHIMGEPATSINRNYLKFKSELVPYAYSIAYEAVNGLPMIRPMFIEEANNYTASKNTEYQFMYGPYLLVAPIYKETQIDEKGNDIRDGIYLPKGKWFDFYNGEVFQGPCIINNFNAPLWKLPLFVKEGAIIPLANPSNNPTEIDKTYRIYEFYPAPYSQFIAYDDDGITNEYINGKFATTRIESQNKDRELHISIHPTQGDFKNKTVQKQTEIRVNCTKEPKTVKAKIGGKKIKLREVASLKELKLSTDCYFYNRQPNLNRFSTPNTQISNTPIIKNPKLVIKLAATNTYKNEITINIKGYEYSKGNQSQISKGEIGAPKVDKANINIEAYQITPKWEPVKNADYYEILFNNIRYTTIKNNFLTFDNLSPETKYQFKIRAVNADMTSEWSSFFAETKSNPLEFAIPNIQGEIDVEDQPNSEIAKLFDFDEANLWHTKWGKSATPFNIIVDLKTINQLDKIHYLPRISSGNGNILKGSIYHSLDKKNWIKETDFTWAQNDSTKIVTLKDKPTARFVKISVSESIGNFGSGRELYIFKVPNTESYIPGDINHDKLIDNNDLTSYTNYTGLRYGDADFEGYISKGDINGNNLIDAYDIAVLTTQLNGGVKHEKELAIEGNITLKTNKTHFNKGEVVEIDVVGSKMKNLYAMSFALPYDNSVLEFLSIEPIGVKNMLNLTNNRLHSFGLQALYPTFTNIGESSCIEGSKLLFKIKFKTKKRYKYDLKMSDLLLVNKELNFIEIK